MKRIGVPTLRGWCTFIVGALSAITGFLFGSHELFALGLFAVVSIVCAWLWSCRPMPQTNGSIQDTAALSVDQPGSLNLFLSLPKRGLRALRLRVDLPPQLGDSIQLDLSSFNQRWVDDRVQCEKRIHVIPRTRGVVAVEKVILERSDAWGFSRRTSSVVAPRSFLVRPRLCEVPTHVAEALKNSTFSLVGLRDSSPISALVRSYVPGDDLRRIHWRSTAKTGTLMTRYEEQAPDALCRILVDSTIGDGCEKTIEVSASIARDCVNTGSPTLLMADAHVRTGSMTLEEILDSAALITPKDSRNVREDMEFNLFTADELRTSALIAVIQSTSSDCAQLLASSTFTGIKLAIVIGHPTGIERILRDGEWNVIPWNAPHLGAS